MLRRIAGVCLAASVCLTGALPAAAQTPPPLTAALFAFPGSFVHPATGISASLGLADRWLGEGPYDNPAVEPRNEVVVSPALLHSSRQDLRRVNRGFDETPAFLDAAGAELRGGVGGFAFAAYAHQPLLQQGDYAYSQGDPLLNPGTLQVQFTAREVRGGAALAYGRGRLRGGVAVEYSRRDDTYDTIETSGAPTAGTRHLDFSGDGIGIRAGVRARVGGNDRGGIEIGAGFRQVPAITLTGEGRSDLLTGTDEGTIRVDREATSEYGVSLRASVTGAFRVLASGGARGGAQWTSVSTTSSGTYDTFSASSDGGSEWKLALEYHDERDPWALRAGAGAEVERGVPESRAGVFGLGVSWFLDSTRLDFGLLRRSLERANQPKSYEDRIVVSVTQALE